MSASASTAAALPIDYDELRAGRWLRDQSFTGHGGGADVSVYHLFNPGARIPLNGILRGAFRYVAYLRDSHNPSDFALPPNQPIASVRAGLRFGGVEPVLRAGSRCRKCRAGTRGRSDSTRAPTDSPAIATCNRRVHLFWARALLIYTMPKSEQRLSLHVIGGTSVHPDRFSAYRHRRHVHARVRVPIWSCRAITRRRAQRAQVRAGGRRLRDAHRCGQRWQLGFGASQCADRVHAGTRTAARVEFGHERRARLCADRRPGRRRSFTAMRLMRFAAAVAAADSVSVMMEFDLERLGYLKGDATSHRDPQ